MPTRGVPTLFLFGVGGFLLGDYFDDTVKMVGHDYIFIQNCIFKSFWNVIPFPENHATGII